MFKRSRHKNAAALFTTFKFSTPWFFFFLVLIFFGALEFKVFEVKYKDQFYPNIFVGGESVGGQTYADVLSRFKARALELEKHGLSLNFEGPKGVRTTNIPMSTTGLTSDTLIEYFALGNWENDLLKAYEWGRETNIFHRLTSQLTLLFTKKSFNFSTVFKKEATNSLLENGLYFFLKKSVPARFAFAGNQIIVVREEIGESINKEEVINVLEKKLIQLDATPATFKVYTDVPRITKARLEPFLGFAKNFAAKNNLIFKHQEHEWRVKGSKIVTWFTLNQKDSIVIDSIKLDNYLASTVAKSVDNPPRNSRFEMRNGKLVEIVSGKSGNVVDAGKVLQKIEKIISETGSNSEARTIIVPIETIEIEPKVTKQTIEEYHIKDLVGEVRTSFEGSSANREHNIKIGVATINGILIPPGAEFSTVESIGPVSEKEGYVKELVIKEDRTMKEFGGGLCQVATTLFRLALNAGLQITERVNHRFVVPYYDPPGLDATIYGPHPDLRFVNDTNNYLLLQARVENKQVIMELYGQKDGRSVEISKPYFSNQIPAPKTKYVQSAELPFGETQCFETPHDGVTTNVLYTVKYFDGTTKEKDFKSIYQPWQKICLVGTAVPSSP